MLARSFLSIPAHDKMFCLQVDSQEKTELPNPETVESSQKVNEEAVKKSAEPNKEADEPSGKLVQSPSSLKGHQEGL